MKDGCRHDEQGAGGQLAPLSQILAELEAKHFLSKVPALLIAPSDFQTFCRLCEKWLPSRTGVKWT